MKKLTLLIILVPLFSLAQIDYTKEATTDLTKLDSIFKESYTTFKQAKDSLQVLSQKLSPKLTEYYKEVKTIKDETDLIYKKAKLSIAFYSDKGVTDEDIKRVIRLPDDYETGVDFKNEKIKEQTYLLFGDNKLISADSILNNATASKILKDVFSADSESYFGDFWFPMDKQKIKVKKKLENDCASLKITKKRFKSELSATKKTKTNNYNSVLDNLEKATKAFLKCKNEKKSVIKTLFFDRVIFEVHEGTIRDIRVFLKDARNNIHVFTNKSPISLLRYNKLSGLNTLYHTSNQSIDDESYENFGVRLSDILRYFYSVEGNYIPNDVSFSFPLLDNKIKSNTAYSNKYELRQSTALNNVIDLRAYTDVFGLADAYPNGIAQFEGRADFFVNPNNCKDSQIFFVKKFQPYFSYSRFEEGDQLLTPEVLENEVGRTLIEPLEHLQKSYFDVGVKLDFMSFKPHKQIPFEAVFYTAVRYQVARLKISDDEISNYTVLGVGGGLELEFKRFSNFALNYSVDFLKYRHGPYNNIDGIIDPSDFFVMRNEFEVSYFPIKKKSNAIFMRLRVFDNLESKNGSNFFQVQFGYKFTIGAGKIKVNK